MPDRKKVISELNEYIESALAICAPDVDYIPVDLLQYTVALLKEQEAVKPKIDAFGHPYCPKCKVLVYETWEFCPHCGKEMKWNVERQ